MPAANVHATIDKHIYCPFGCTATQHDEHMYCCHLKGFTSKGKKFEPVFRTSKGGVSVRAVEVVPGEDEFGNETTQVKSVIEPVLPKDVLVNPEYVQKDDMGSHMAKKWVHARVYRNCTEEEAQSWRAKYVAMIEEDDEAGLLETV